jgi:hypothetical protein
MLSFVSELVPAAARRDCRVSCKVGRKVAVLNSHGAPAPGSQPTKKLSLSNRDEQYLRWIVLSC